MRTHDLSRLKILVQPRKEGINLQIKELKRKFSLLFKTLDLLKEETTKYKENITIRNLNLKQEQVNRTLCLT